MEIVVGIIVAVFVFAIIGVCAVVAFMVIRGIFRAVFAPINSSADNGVATDIGMSAEEEGNVHSGPYGYSPNTAYPETQYGSMFDPDAEWNHEEQ